MRRFYLTVYLAVLGSIVIFGVMAAVLWHVTDEDEDTGRQQRIRAVSELIAEAAPGPSASAQELNVWLDRQAARFDSDVSLFTAEGVLLASSGREMGSPIIDDDDNLEIERAGDGIRLDIRLPDGRFLSAYHPWDRKRRGPPKWLAALLVLGLAVAIGAYPVARRITRRVEELRTGVDELGGGDLAARVPVRGKDEIAELARSFNQAASRIESLVEGQRNMLASASHELRSPLTRIRMGIELLAGDERAALKDQLNRDIGELDELIEELLFASRLETQQALPRTEPVDLLALLAEEAARVDAAVHGESAVVHGDPKLLRRLVRNLLENAVRHGKGTPVTATVRATPGGGCVLSVEDEGPGVPLELRERIFEAFYRPPGMREGEDKGVGLGLALVRRIAERHGGAARCEPREPQGTRFVIELPESQPENHQGD